MKIVKLPIDVISFVWTTDWHLSDKPPGRRRDDYRKAMFEKLAFVRALCHETNSIGLCGGDVFHIKNPDSDANSFSLLYQLMKVLHEFPTGKVYGAIGNHDLMFDRMETLPSQPLGLLIAANVYRDLTAEPILFQNASGTVGVLVEAFPFAGGEETLQRLQNAGKRPSELPCGRLYRIGIVHAYGQGGGADLLWGERKIGYDEVKDLDFDFLLWGHDHSRHETETAGNITHVNLGAMARAAFATDEVERPVVATVLTFNETGYTNKEVTIPVTPLEIAFTVADKAVEQVAKSDKVTEFFTEMNEAVDGIESSEPREVMTQLCPDDPELLAFTLNICEL